uniref:Uncharacterized protein n=1 Tax=Acanthochromis polyacanthus TaxID=80966 RepID=A0A3Q1EKM5_9TELE
MKTFCVVVAVAVVFTFIYIQGNSVFPFTTMQESEETMSNDSPAASQEETSVETWMVRSPHQISDFSFKLPRGFCCQFWVKLIFICCLRFNCIQQL